MLGHKSVTSTEIYARVVAFDDSTVNQFEVKEVASKEERDALVTNRMGVRFSGPEGRNLCLQEEDQSHLEVIMISDD